MPRSLIQDLTNIAKAKADGFEDDPQTLSQILWSLRVLRVGNGDAFEIESVKVLVSAFERGHLCEQAISQLHQVLHCLELEGSSTFVATQDQIQAIRKAHVRMIAARANSSLMHSTVVEVLSDMGVCGFVEEHDVADLGYVVDVAFVDKRVALEIDGPIHFWRSEDMMWQYDGYTKLKQRILEQLGWRVVRVPFFEWYPLKTTAQKEDFLTGKLSRILSERQ